MRYLKFLPTAFILTMLGVLIFLGFEAFTFFNFSLRGL